MTFNIGTSVRLVEDISLVVDEYKSVIPKGSEGTVMAPGASESYVLWDKTYPCCSVENTRLTVSLPTFGV